MKKKTGMIVAIVVIVVVLIGLIYLVGHPKTVVKVDPDMEAIMDTCLVERPKAEVILNVFKESGVIEIQEIIRDKTMDNEYREGDYGYRVVTKDAGEFLVYMTADKEVQMIKLGEQVLYPAAE